MDCNLCRKKIIPFLNKELNDKERRQLLLHFDKCDGCREEVKLHYFVGEGLKRLEEGGNLNLEQEFNDMIYDERLQSDSVHKSNVVMNMVAFLSVAFAAFILIRSLFLL